MKDLNINRHERITVHNSTYPLQEAAQLKGGVYLRTASGCDKILVIGNP